MKAIDTGSLARLRLDFIWKGTIATHTERYLADKVNMWRDIFPVRLDQELHGRKKGEICTFHFEPGELLEAYSQKAIRAVPSRQVATPTLDGQPRRLRVGRFYPQGLLRGVSGIYPQSLAPMRVLEADDTTLKVDLNHPLAAIPLDLEIKILSVTERRGMERGGRCNACLEESLENGPGMQIRLPDMATDFGELQGLDRQDASADSLFYRTPRLVGHVDSLASSFIASEYLKYLQPGDKILDLMSSLESHLPLTKDFEVIGLGLNSEEMSRNPILKSHLIHDLNKEQILPFADASFQAVLCSLSIEYMTNPIDIIKELRRILVPGGVVLISFSDRWFPPKVTRLWTELHEFERPGLVLEFLFRAGGFGHMHTLSIRNWPRPENDRHATVRMVSDPIHIVMSRKDGD